MKQVSLVCRMPYSRRKCGSDLLCFSQTHPLLSHSGFEHCFCYGDVLLSFLWVCEAGSGEATKCGAAAAEGAATPYGTGATASSTDHRTRHDFIRTQFHRTTHCDFCSKKVGNYFFYI